MRTDFEVFIEQADLSKPETIPATLVGIHTIIDCATGRPEEPIRKVSFVLKIDFIPFLMNDLFLSLCFL